MVLYYRKKHRNFFFFLVIPVSILILFLISLFQVSPIFLKLSENKIYSITFKLINDVVSQELTKIDTNELIDYKYSDSGGVTAVNANVITMNKLSTNISKTITEQLSKLTKIYVKLPIGSFINGNFLAGTGPEIPIQIVLLNNVSTTYNTDFYSTGINQTCHKIFIKVTCNIRVLSRLTKSDIPVVIEIPIAETIIVGNVPTTYLELKK